jgi:hypothetical protein
MDDRFDALLELVAAFPVAERETPGVCERWSLKDVLAHVRSWHLMFLGWEEEGRRGAKPEMPAPGFTWKMTPELNRALYEECKDEPWDEVVVGLQISHREVREVVSAYGDDLFEKRKYPWTGSTSVGSYAVSATSSHYDWAAKLVRAFVRTSQAA